MMETRQKMKVGKNHRKDGVGSGPVTELRPVGMSH